jgi:glucose-1-phosphate adenylyltransferase
MIAESAVVKDSIILSDSVIGQGCIIDRSIVDKEVVVEAGANIGFGIDFQVNREESKLLTTGITILGKKARVLTGVKMGRNCVICCGVTEDDFPDLEIQSGETIKPKRRPIRREK